MANISDNQALNHILALLVDSILILSLNNAKKVFLLRVQLTSIHVLKFSQWLTCKMLKQE